MTTFVWLLPFFPAAGAAINGLFGIRWFSRGVTAAIACVSMLVSLALAIAGGVNAARAPIAREVFLGEWIPPIPAVTLKGAAAFHASWVLLIDPLAAVMALVVTGIGFLIHLYSTAYMRSEPRGSYARFFCYLNLFCAFMLLLVLGGNFIVMFVGWEGVGLCSYLLIGFWYHKGSAANAGRKAFIVNRIGDWGFLVGIMAAFFAFGTLDFQAVAAQAGRWPIERAQFGGLSIICLLLFVGAAGKSAQIPLYVWLPDAMEGPTPVSALIHAATMVTAGVYIVARNAVLFSHAPLVLAIIAIVGALTALMAASIAIVQTDIKRVLAYSTISQLGLMFLAAGVGAVSAAVFHLVTHAFFKALLFLGSGAVIHAMAGEQDLRRMGGLKRYLPVTFVTMVVGALAIAGIPPLAGFFSKDEILLQTFGRNRALWVLASITSLLTAFYMFRLIAFTFYGTDEPSSPHPPHEAPGTMTVPLMILAIGTIVVGFMGIPRTLGGANAIEHFLAPSIAETRAVAFLKVAGQPDPPGTQEMIAQAREELERDRAAHRAAFPVSEATEGRAWALMLLSTLLGATGMAAAWRFYVNHPEVPRRAAERWSGVHALLLNKYYVDDLYDATIVRGTFGAARELWRVDLRLIDGFVNAWGVTTRVLAWMSHMIDKVGVDGAVNAAGWSAGEGSFLVRRGQTGLVQNYALVIILGLFGFLTVYLLAR
ncbi:MAG: NADH-quinone oxidoreductase subunit L [Acidobacteria bacterium]|nr:MAG: NADH-quinone oxidoreductase subunit L [Acidobacteriota bacterium]